MRSGRIWAAAALGTALAQSCTATTGSIGCQKFGFVHTGISVESMIQRAEQTAHIGRKGCASVPRTEVAAQPRPVAMSMLPRREASLLLSLTFPLQPAAAAFFNPFKVDPDEVEGSELAPVVKDGKPSPILLVPVLDASRSLETVAALVVADKLADAAAIAGGKPFLPARNLKRILNAYSDNIYTSDQSRKNMYLDGSAMLGMGTSTVGFGTFSVGAGGASPESAETMTYLYRNQIIDNCDALAAELRYLVQQDGVDMHESREDLLKYLSAAREAFASYLASLPSVQSCPTYLATCRKSAYSFS